MEEVLLWLFRQFAFLTEKALSWKIIRDFSFLHIILGGVLIVVLINFITFGVANVGGTAEYVGNVRKQRNRENSRDRSNYVKINKHTGEVVK